ncbi:MAG: low-complexity protein [Gammaproteobacteria bacterium]|nr:low-complexity protein [Gammaproteobacteria bacterium]
MSNLKKSVSIAMGATFAASMAASPIANADQNPFGMQNLDSGYMQLAEAKCGANMEKETEGKCGESKKEAEGKCGQGKKDAEGKCGEAKKAAAAKEKEGKCGEAKCGANK